MDGDNRIVFQCSECNAQLSAVAEVAGQTGKCPRCGKDIQVPAASQQGAVTDSQ